MKGYVVFGRMNPPTKGHSKLIEKLNDLASGADSRGFLYVSHTVNKPADYRKAAKSDGSPEAIASILKNPLTWEEKIDFIHRIYDGRYENVYIADDPNAKNLNTIFTSVHEAGITDVVLVCGQDRMEEYIHYLDRYQADPATPVFNSVDVVSAGDRDPDAEGTEGISATKVRLAVLNDDVELFSTYIDTDDDALLADLFVAIENSFTN